MANRKGTNETEINNPLLPPTVKMVVNDFSGSSNCINIPGEVNDKQIKQLEKLAENLKKQNIDKVLQPQHALGANRPIRTPKRRIPKGPSVELENVPEPMDWEKPVEVIKKRKLE